MSSVIDGLKSLLARLNTSSEDREHCHRRSSDGTRSSDGKEWWTSGDGRMRKCNLPPS